MQTRLDKILQIFTTQGLVYLKGPEGSGKTFLVRDFSQMLAQNEHRQKTFFIYTGFSLHSPGNDCKRRIESPVCEAFYTYLDESRVWQDCDETIADFMHVTVSSLRGAEQPGDVAIFDDIAIWQKLHHHIKALGYKLVIIIDDYDLWRSPTTDFTALLKLSEEKVLFIFTSREPATFDDADDTERKFLERFHVLSLSSPSSDEAAEISRTSWLKWKDKAGETFQLEDIMSTDQIKNITGNYPVLINCLVETIARTIASMRSAKLSSIEEIVKRTDFIDKIIKSEEFTLKARCLWQSLSESQKQALGLVTLAQETGQRLSEVYKRWQMYHPRKALTLERFNTVLASLRDDRLLLKGKSLTFSISATAIANCQPNQKIVWEMAKKTGTPVTKPPDFDQQAFLKRWFGGLYAYIGLVVIWWLSSPLLSKIIGFKLKLPGEIFLITWIPALFYVMRYAKRKVFHS